MTFTFTDFVFEYEGQLNVLKIPTARSETAESLQTGLRALGVEDNIPVIHGTTTATNALLERQGARTALITTGGFEDVLELRRQQRPSLYTFSQPQSESLVPRARRFGVEERIAASGEILKSLSRIELEQLCESLTNASVESVAVVFLFSFLDYAYTLS